MSMPKAFQNGAVNGQSDQEISVNWQVAVHSELQQCHLGGEVKGQKSMAENQHSQIAEMR